ncbi:AAA family ATPase [Saccharopolyspora sp. 6M]|uniref:AAA family ATPase n=1 Tax=Saccharopolyspora sp. 6M TaxID=2877237 RepID=UPI001CD74895|nr:AAA family ATPase [Saccharopolyspora sp. 6M]MCA1229556.1 AAA family ATPase [Saccharopolyspora sp. 6M]
MTTTPTTPAPSSGRLRNGELRAQVAGVLAADRKADHSPRQVATALNRSAGAVGNALKKLAEEGAAEVTSAAPLRYKATRTTRKAATPPADTGAGSKAAPAAKSGTGRATAKTGATAKKPTTTSSAPASRKAATADTIGTSPKPGKAGAAGKPGKAAGSTVPGAVSSAVAVSGPVARPNGQQYHPRTLAGLPDVTALRKLREADVPVLLYGPPGTGKTAIAEAAFPDLLTVSGDGDTTVADLVGEYTQTPDGRYEFVHGPLVHAMREGRPLFIDDASLIPPTVLAVVYPAMDGRREVVIKANGGEKVTTAPGFYVIAGHNPGVHGAIVTDALSSRFSAHIQVSSDYDLAAQLKIEPKAVRIARNLATKQRAGEIGWAPQLRELIAFDRIAGVLGTNAAAGNLLNLAPEEDRDTVAGVVRSVFGGAIAPLALGGRI